MPLTLELTPEMEQALEQLAQAEHQSTTAYATQILVSHLVPIAPETQTLVQTRRENARSPKLERKQPSESEIAARLAAFDA